MDSKFTSGMIFIILAGFLLFPISAFSEDTDSLVVSESGNVGIGTATPNSKLHVYDGELTITDSPNPFIWFKNKDTGELNSITTSGKDLYIGGSPEGGAIGFRTKANFGQSMHIDPSGNVGIGMTNPGLKLDIAGQTRIINPNGRSLLIERDDADSWITFHDPGSYWYSMGIDQSDGGKFKLNSGEQVGDNTHFTMTGSGNVGIGTANPGYKLDVNGTISAQTVNAQNVVLEDLSVDKTLIQNMQQQIATLQAQVATLQGQNANQQASIDSIWAWINNYNSGGGGP